MRIDSRLNKFLMQSINHAKGDILDAYQVVSDGMFCGVQVSGGELELLEEAESILGYLVDQGYSKLS